MDWHISSDVVTLVEKVVCIFTELSVLHMYWIVFLSFASIPGEESNDNRVTLLDVPSFAKGQEFQTVEQCQRFLADGFLNGQFPKLQNDERRWQLIQSGKVIEGISHDHNKNIVFSYQIRCVENPIKE